MVQSRILHMRMAITTHIMVTSMSEIRQVLLILPGPSLSLRGLPVIIHRHFVHVDLTATAPVSDEEGPTAATAGDCKSSSRKRKEDGIPLSSASAAEYRSSSKEDPTYSYLVKIIPPNNKKRATVHEMYDVERRFESPDALKAQIIGSFGDKVVQNYGQFQIGYFEGRGSGKRWISSDRHLNKMYSLFESGSRITLA